MKWGNEAFARSLMCRCVTMLPICPFAHLPIYPCPFTTGGASESEMNETPTSNSPSLHLPKPLAYIRLHHPLAFQSRCLKSQIFIYATPQPSKERPRCRVGPSQQTLRAPRVIRIVISGCLKIRLRESVRQTLCCIEMAAIKAFNLSHSAPRPK